MAVRQIPRGRRRRVVPIVIAVVLLLALIAAGAGLYTDLLWFREVGFSDVFTTTLRTKLLLFAVFGLRWRPSSARTSSRAPAAPAVPARCRWSSRTSTATGVAIEPLPAWSSSLAVAALSG